MGETRLIKRYANRKMYDTTRSCYVTLEEVAEMVREGHDVSVIDNKTKDDLTEVTLTQALLDSERKRRGTVPLSGLKTLISQGNDFLHKRVAEPVYRAREEAERTVATWKDEAGKTIGALRTEAERRAERVLSRKPGSEAEGQPAPGETESSAVELKQGVSAVVDQTQRALDDLQHRVDEAMHQAVAALGLATERELSELRSRIATLEARVAELERERSVQEAVLTEP